MTVTRKAKVLVGWAHKEAVKSILRQYEGRVNWVWRNRVITSRLIIEVTGNDAWRLNHDLSVYFET